MLAHHYYFYEVDTILIQHWWYFLLAFLRLLMFLNLWICHLYHYVFFSVVIFWWNRDVWQHYCCLTIHHDRSQVTLWRASYSFLKMCFGSWNHCCLMYLGFVYIRVIVRLFRISCHFWIEIVVLFYLMIVSLVLSFLFISLYVCSFLVYFGEVVMEIQILLVEIGLIFFFWFSQ